MRLLLDEMLSAEVAVQLRLRGHDASAVAERAELRGLPDVDLFDGAQAEGWATVTYNREDFLALDRWYRHAGRDHHGIVIVHPRRFPQQAASIGPLFTSLEGLLAGEPSYPSFVHWLQ